MKKILLTLLAFMATMAVNAEQVSKKQALQKAQQFMPGKQFGEGRSFARSGNLSESEPFYVFNADGNQGFVIVSGDDRTTEILGYSKTGSLDLNRLPENLKGWLDGYARQIEALGTSLKPAKKAKTRGADSWAAIAPMIQTKWNQYYPYNMMCPDKNGYDWRDAGFDTGHLMTNDQTFYHCVTGCVATAMAQIMYYHKHPQSCPAIDQYEITSKGWTINGLPETDFKWADMKETYNGNETDASADAVAELMRYCGQAVTMKYGIGGSSAHVSAEVMAGVFGYSKKCRELYRDPYTTSQWEEMVYGELAAGRPVLYSGNTGDGGGHEFIVDGYDGNGLFHMNWGWGGMSDDYYFVLSLAEPKVQGAGGSNGAYQFDQSALFGVEPGGEEETLMPKMVSNISPMATAEYTRASADADFTNVVFNGIVYITLNTPYTTDKEVQFGWALCQNGQVKQAVPSKKITLSAGQTYTGSDLTTNTKATLGAGLELGKYDVCQVYRFTEDDAWSLCDYYWNPYPFTQYRTAFLVADVTETTLTVRQPVPSFKVNTITTTEYPSTDSPLDVTLNVTNDGETFEQVMCLWAQKEGEEDWTPVAKATRKIDPGKSEDVVMSYKPTVAGNYTLKITNAVSEEALKTAAVTVYASIDATVGNLKFVCHSKTKKARLVGHTYPSGATVDVNIPSTIDGGQYTVNEIADGAFKGFGLLSAVTIPSTVETIGDGAFYNCYRLSELTVPEGVKHIGESAFQACYWLETLKLPSTLLNIGDNAFYECPLKTVVVAMTTPLEIARNVFMTVEEVAGEDVEVFTSADLFVPIGQKAAYSAAEVWKEFPTMYQGELKDITLEDGITYSYVTGEDFAIVKSGNPAILKDKDVVIPSTILAEGKTYKVKKIADNAFVQVFMKSLTIQPGVEEIGIRAFRNSYKIQNLVLPNSVKSIGAYAFHSVFWLHTLELPASLTSIGEYAFGDNSDLTSVVSHITSPFDIADNVFAIEDGGNMLAPTASLTVPYGSKTKYEAAAGWKLFQPITEMEPQGTPGDANGDGGVDASDIDVVVRYIMEGDFEGFKFGNANLNGDDKVDTADLVLLINMVK